MLILVVKPRHNSRGRMRTKEFTGFGRKRRSPPNPNPGQEWGKVEVPCDIPRKSRYDSLGNSKNNKKINAFFSHVPTEFYCARTLTLQSGT